MESFLRWPLAGSPGYFGLGTGQQESTTGCQHPVWFLSPTGQWGSPCAVLGLQVLSLALLEEWPVRSVGPEGGTEHLGVPPLGGSGSKWLRPAPPHIHPGAFSRTCSLLDLLQEGSKDQGRLPPDPRSPIGQASRHTELTWS